MECVFLVVSSITYALKAKAVFEDYSIACRIEKIRNVAVLKGCGYGIRISRSDKSRSLALLRREGLRVVDIIDCTDGES